MAKVVHFPSKWLVGAMLSDKQDEIPYAIYEWLWGAKRDDPAWRQMFADGLGVIRHLCCYTEEMRNVEVDEATYEEDGLTIKRWTYTTPVGSIHETWRNGWQGEHFLKGLEDYRVMTYVAENTVVTPDLEKFEADLAALAPREVALSLLSRTPYQR